MLKAIVLCLVLCATLSMGIVIVMALPAGSPEQATVGGVLFVLWLVGLLVTILNLDWIGLGGGNTTTHTETHYREVIREQVPVRIPPPPVPVQTRNTNITLEQVEEIGRYLVSLHQAGMVQAWEEMAEKYERMLDLQAGAFRQMLGMQQQHHQEVKEQFQEEIKRNQEVIRILASKLGDAAVASHLDKAVKVARLHADKYDNVYLVYPPRRVRPEGVVVALGVNEADYCSYQKTGKTLPPPTGPRVVEFDTIIEYRQLPRPRSRQPQLQRLSSEAPAVDADYRVVKDEKEVGENNSYYQ
jgi:hypothetical protein